MLLPERFTDRAHTQHHMKVGTHDTNQVGKYTLRVIIDTFFLDDVAQSGSHLLNHKMYMRKDSTSRMIKSILQASSVHLMFDDKLGNASRQFIQLYISLLKQLLHLNF